MDEYIKFDDAIKAMDELEEEDIESYGCKCAECFDGERARLAICLLPRWKATGHWIDMGSGQECSECGEIQYGYDNFRYFCANCGAKMQ